MAAIFKFLLAIFRAFVSISPKRYRSTTITLFLWRIEKIKALQMKPNAKLSSEGTDARTTKSLPYLTLEI